MGSTRLLSAVALAVALLAFACEGTMAESLIYNGSFQQVKDGAPEGWQTAGRKEIVQTLTAQADPERGTAARLECTQFAAGTPDSHVMLAQLGRVGVTRGQWYRLRLWMREKGLAEGAVSVALTDTSVWSDVGLSRSFPVGTRWQQYDVTFQATQDLAPAKSRFQIWFGGTGTLWVAGVALEAASEVRREWFSQLPLTGVTNAIPNSSFECGGAGWGCWTGRDATWGTNIFHRAGEWDGARGFHGKASWRLSIPDASAPMLYFDYYDPVAAPVRSLLLGHEGWVPVGRGRPYTFSAYVAADRPGTPVRMVIQEADGRRQSRTFAAGTDWARVELTFTAQRDFACGFVGLDLTDSDRRDGTLWVDAVQFEAGPQATAYRPRQEVEAFAEMDPPGNIFTEPAKGVRYRLRAYNDADQERVLRGTTDITDFRDASPGKQQVSVPVPAKSAVTQQVTIAGSRLGFFRLRWKQESEAPQDLRYAVLEPVPAGDTRGGDSIFGMNHAFGDGFLLPLSHAAGLRWWRDWSAQWRLVQPKPDGFDFSIPDAQINRVQAAGGMVDVLLPFPSAPWASSPDEKLMKEAAGPRTWELEQMRTAFKPRSLDQWADYVRATVSHYRTGTHTFEILNEPLYTTYALPQRFGYDLPDYLDMLRAAYKAAKEADPDCTVVGGIAAGPSSEFCRRFIAEGGLEWCDAVNYHIYPNSGWAESHENALQARLKEMTARGQLRPVWMTEFGLYAEDDPASRPVEVGDSTMANAMRPTELDAAADLVRFAAVFCSTGVRKIFYHAGTCSALNQSSAGNMFFEYGGAPRKQYAAQATLAGLLGADFQFVRKWTEPASLAAYEFRSRGRTVVIAWTRAEKPIALELPDGLRALDLMGNGLPERTVRVDDIPIYLVSPPAPGGGA